MTPLPLGTGGWADEGVDLSEALNLFMVANFVTATTGPPWENNENGRETRSLR